MDWYAFPEWCGESSAWPFRHGNPAHTLIISTGFQKNFKNCSRDSTPAGAKILARVLTCLNPLPSRSGILGLIASE
jgi:hypothetical protein